MSIYCIGRNYVAHAKELGNEVPTSPVIFMKPSTALLNKGEQLTIPSFTKDLHYEAELVLRVNKVAKKVKNAHVMDYCDAISVGIDFTARDVQNDLKAKGLPWEKAKAFDDSAVIGEWIPLTEDMFENPFHYSMTQNGNTVQEGDSSLMIYGLSQIIESITEYFTLYPDDLIYTGTPAGVGPTHQGDVFEGFFEGKSVFKIQVNP
ncbi:MAG: fumarylacetoacetate hydrolase family protein [Sediminibacterium sp.]|jgi:2-keto-4-pentenoate hydratase/2-oxohepta-3-ene-1,7-dioic acid hydratase in catechol pathway|nr:fumarylacetoacetate hydrolase family protein [Sediminibacterium sp.]